MASPWSPAQHGVDVNGYVSQAHYDAPHSPASYGSGDHQQQQQQQGDGGAPSSPGRRALAWFKKPTSKSRSRERRDDGSASPNGDAGGARTPSPTFVVRNVTKQPGGVSLDASYSATATSPARRMTLDDEDEAAGQLNYSRSRSKPIGAPSLGVPPGGRGGGTGYGMAGSSNDGRPIHPDAYGAEQGSWSRGRSPSTGRPASPGAMTAGAFRTQSNSRVSPGPQSFSQVQQQQQQQQQQFSPAPAAGKQAPRGPRNAPGMGGSSPTHAALSSSPLAPQLSGAQAHAHGYGQALEQQQQQHQQSRQSSYPVSRSIDMRNGPPPVIPLDGMPSPISIPRPMDSPHSQSPLGTPSPGRSPDGRAQATNGSPSLGAGAGKWMSKLFSRSPRADSPAAGETYGWERGTSPNPGATPYGLATPNWPSGGGAHKTDDEREAALQKRASQREAARIVDAERAALMARPTQHTDTTPWSPRQAVPDATDMSLERQTRSPPGRKPVPRFDEESLQNPNPDLTAEQLRRMSIGTREDVAKQLDPHDALSRLEGRLTPAQQIIAETRSKHLAREKLQADAARRNGGAAQVTRGFDPSTPTAATHERDASKGPTLPSKSPAPSRLKASDPPTEDDTLVASSQAEEAEIPVRRGSCRAPASNSPSKAAGAQASASAAATPSRGAVLPKAGGASGLQPGNGPMPIDMPLPAALQEMMVRFYRFERYAVPLIRSLESRLIDIERDAQLAINGDAASANSARDREMDRWVGQMTGLMKHEVGQLKAATREIREGRELLASAVGAKSPMTNTSSGFMQRDAATQDSLSSTKADTGASAPKPPLTPIVTDRFEAGVSKAQAVRTPVSALDGHADRTNNISSASFNSAVPRGGAALGLPVGAKPALDKDQGKSAHGKAFVEVEGAKRERSTSPGGRPRFTSALGEPMQAGRISPGMPRREASENSLEPPPANRFASGSANNIHRGASPAPSEASSNVSGRSRGGRSLDERLKSLVVENQLKSPVSNSQLSIAEQDDGEVEDDATSSKVGDDYPLRNAHVVREDETVVPAHYPITSVRVRANSHVQQASGSSQATYTPKPSGASVHRSNTLAAPSAAPPLLGGRTSPSPSSHSAHSPNARRSTSPANFVPPPPPVSASAITTSANMSLGIRARAQSYLATADSVPPSPASAAVASTPSAMRGTSPTPSSWISGGRGSEHSTTSPTRRSVSPSKLETSSPPKLGRPLSSYSSAGALARSGSATQPLSIKKSAGALSAKSTPASPAIGTTARKGPPPGASLKDRVAFFDQASS